MTTNKPAAACLYQAEGQQTEYLVRQPSGQVFRTAATRLPPNQTLLMELWNEYQEQENKKAL